MKTGDDFDLQHLLKHILVEVNEDLRKDPQKSHTRAPRKCAVVSHQGAALNNFASRRIYSAPKNKRPFKSHATCDARITITCEAITIAGRPHADGSVNRVRFELANPRVVQGLADYFRNMGIHKLSIE